MSLTTFALIMSAVVLNTAAQFLLKAGATALSGLSAAGASAWSLLLSGITNLPVLAGLACYVASFGLWIGVLARLEVSAAYPLLSIGYVIGALVAYFFFGESLSLNKMLGIGFIVVGVVFIARA
ncbi:MAG: EamA family transporter [Burkholderiaceae bacterium]|nr:EamA family transporter [Burkholderiaceae bacterium]